MAAAIRRGDICWARLDPAMGHEQGGTRPVLVISRDVFNRTSGTVLVLPLTSSEPRAGFPLTLELSSPQLPKRSWVKVAQIRTISVNRIEGVLASVDAGQVDVAVEALNEIVGS